MLHGIVAQAVVGLFFFLVEAVLSQKFLRTDGHNTPPENRRPLNRYGVSARLVFNPCRRFRD
jgi:hypothetical protein